MSIKLAEKKGQKLEFARPFPAFNQVLPEQREKFILNLLVLTIFFCLTKYGRYGNLISARELAIANQSKFQIGGFVYGYIYHCRNPAHPRGAGSAQHHQDPFLRGLQRLLGKLRRLLWVLGPYGAQNREHQILNPTTLF